MRFVGETGTCPFAEFDAESGRRRSKQIPIIEDECLIRQLLAPGDVDADGFVLATNCYCFYTDDKGPNANPVGALWRVMPADKVSAGMEVAKTKGN